MASQQHSFVFEGKEFQLWTETQLEKLNRAALKNRALALRDHVGRERIPPMPRHPEDLVVWILQVQRLLLQPDQGGTGPRPGSPGHWNAGGPGSRGGGENDMGMGMSMGKGGKYGGKGGMSYEEDDMYGHQPGGYSGGKGGGGMYYEEDDMREPFPQDNRGGPNYFQDHMSGPAGPGDMGRYGGPGARGPYGDDEDARSGGQFSPRGHNMNGAGTPRGFESRRPHAGSVAVSEMGGSQMGGSPSGRDDFMRGNRYGAGQGDYGLSVTTEAQQAYLDSRKAMQDARNRNQGFGKSIVFG